MLLPHPEARTRWCHKLSRIFRRIGGSGISGSGRSVGVLSGGSLEKVLDVCSMGLEGGLEGLRLGVLNGIEPELNGQFLDYALLHKNLSGGIV
jgi:hypothetical protein